MRGFRMYATSPGLMLLGALPALIVGLVFLAALVVLALNATHLAELPTPFSVSWDEGWRTALRALVAVGLFAAGVALGVVTYAALTLTIGAPFYERIQVATEQRLGGIDRPVELPFWASVRRSIADGLRLLLVAAATALVVFLAGLVPVVGSVVGWTLGALFGGRALALELTGTAGDARGMTLAARRRLLRSRRARSIGFGVCAYLTFLVPGGAVIGTPAASAAGTILLRELRGEATTRSSGLASRVEGRPA
ncbi:EI24 domain-containing protein [Pseudoclavibacter chungangensis]|uniref:EI24 domain-containing protein n=1 Tax=Pseudoclavibacter chungangensis TaxID=587635 RepID=UPI0021F1F967|nr:EI24 domain-containing protein [Pseudoclavibacter chungangensis]